MLDIRDCKPNEALQTKVFVMVAQRGTAEDWAAYALEVPEPFLAQTWHNIVLDYGNKIPEDAAKFQFFPQIGGGPYRQ